MTGEDRRTRAQLLHELARTTAEVDRLKAQALEKQRDDRSPEVRALDACVRAIDAVHPNRITTNYSVGRAERGTDIAWVMQALSSRYGVDLTREVTMRCERDHVDDMSMAQLADQLVKRNVEVPPWQR
jgi:hypothetical protein